MNYEITFTLTKVYYSDSIWDIRQSTYKEYYTFQQTLLNVADSSPYINQACAFETSLLIVSLYLDIGKI